MYPTVTPPGSKEEFQIYGQTDYLGLNHVTKHKDRDMGKGLIGEGTDSNEEGVRRVGKGEGRRREATGDKMPYLYG